MISRIIMKSQTSLLVLLVLGALTASCGAGPETTSESDQAILLAMAVLDKNEDGSPKTLPARMGILTRRGGSWQSRIVEDTDSNAFHKAMAYRSKDGGGGVLTLGGTKALVKLWKPDGSQDVLWESDFGGKFSRMRDAEIGDIYGDGSMAIAVVTHDQGVVAVLRPGADGTFSVEELDRQADTIIHEVELGDLDGDGTLEIYTTPSAPNKLDGTPQPGSVVRYVPARGEGRVEVAALGERHAKEILATDLDGDGKDELYVSVEAVSGGQVEIRRYHADTDPAASNVVATLSDRMCRFLTAGDVDGDGALEMVAAAHKSGLWLLRPAGDRFKKELIASDSSGFEHASILADLDGDGRDELYVASDQQDEVRRYTLAADGWEHEVLLKYDDGLGRFTWNVTISSVALLPP
jgi:hypothetical protein